MSEKLITQKIKTLLKSDNKIWFYKASQRFLSGIPDIVGSVSGRFFAMEIKEASAVTEAQLYTLLEMHKRGGANIAVLCSPAAAHDFIEKVLISQKPVAFCDPDYKFYRKIQCAFNPEAQSQRKIVDP